MAFAPLRFTTSLILLGALIGGALRTASAEGRKPDTPEEAVRLDVGCAAGAAAAQARIGNAATDKQRLDAAKLADLTRAIAVRAASTIGVSPEETTTRIEDQRNIFLDRFKNDASRQEQNLGRFLIECALVQATEQTASKPAVPGPR